ncbi:MAG: YqzL family protein [Clostridia bacterium]|nr:YqzL family protein [Clostridia bacterium]
MRKKKQIKQLLWQQKLTDLAWKNFCESGEIGAYLFYQEVKASYDQTRENYKRHSDPSDRLGRKR